MGQPWYSGAEEEERLSRGHVVQDLSQMRDNVNAARKVMR